MRSSRDYGSKATFINDTPQFAMWNTIILSINVALSNSPSARRGNLRAFDVEFSERSTSISQSVRRRNVQAFDVEILERSTSNAF